MIITVWRHGEAGQASDDRLRELTPRGVTEVTRGALRVQAICQQRGCALPDALWFSRWRRTTQTAELIAAGVPGLSTVSQEALIPGSSPARVASALEPLWQQASPPAHLVLVSHQPLVTRLVDHLLGRPGAAPAHPPGGLVTLSLDGPGAGGARLLWWAFPPNYEAAV
jgi:phosphohistidine phosphatase